jgi:site-specific recombinase XerD
METEVNAFLDSLETSESTRLAYANDLRVFLHFLDRNYEHPPSPSDLNTQQVKAFIEAERQVGRRRNTLIRRLATLKYFREYLVREGLVPINSFSIKDEKIQEVIERVPIEHVLMCLNQDQIDSLVALMDSSSRPRALRDRAMFMLLLETGLSVGDLTALDLTDLDLRAGRFHLNLIGKGDLWLDLGRANQPVRAYLQEGRPDLLLQPGEPALFISQMDGRLSRQGVWQILNHWGSKLEPPISLSPRILRHTAVLRLNKAGFSTADIQIRLGHRSPVSTRALIRRLQSACDQSTRTEKIKMKGRSS